MGKYRILIADDSQQFASSAKAALNEFSVDIALSIAEAKSKFAANYDLILLDLVFDEKHPDDLQGLELIPYIKSNYPNSQILVMTNHQSTEVTVSAIKAGAIDFLNKKELKWIEWKIRIENYCKNSLKIKNLEEINKTLKEKYDSSEIIGVSNEIEYIRKRLRDLAQNSEDITILITGETGTGKNLAAKYFRKHSARGKHPYIEFSICEIAENIIESELFGHIKGSFTGAVQDKKGLFEEAQGGILFLDEIGDYDLKIQKKIMRFLEEKVITRVGSVQKTSVDVQLILATNQNLQQLILDGIFREDLYHRINRVHIHIPPLRERKDDIAFLTDYYFNYFREKEKTNLLKITQEVYDLFEIYYWPGNVRELQSVVWDACTRARLGNEKALRSIHLRNEIRHGGNHVSQLNDNADSIEMKKAVLELNEIEKVLKETNGRKTEAALRLKISIDSLRYKIMKYFKVQSTLITHYPFIAKYYKVK